MVGLTAIHKGYRQLLIDNYVAIYRIDEDKKIVFVMTVQYQGRNIQKWKKPKKTVIHKGQKPTPEQIAEIKKAAMKEFIADEEAPELTLEQYAEMAEFANARRFQSI